jgi:deoxyribonuclease-2
MDVRALDEVGNPVDWWFMYKVPKLSAGAANDSATGYEYVYFDSAASAAGNPVTKSPNRIDEGKGSLNLTLDSVFENPGPSTGYILYNDEMPDSVNRPDDGNLGHTKGVIAFDTSTKTAYWLLHSWPKFADPQATRDPTPMYGQTYLCLSLDLSTASLLAAQMANHQEPQTYFCRRADLPDPDALFKLMQPLQPDAPGDSNVIDLTTKGGMAFKVIAKNRKWNQDFWNGLVGPTLQADMDVETWIRGPIPPIADTDGVHKTFDVKYINLGALGVHWAWPETHDHAKWGITLQDEWVCVGDINRMISQRRRGGGTVAFQNEILWKALSKTSFLLAPPGHTRAQAHDVLRTTHVEHDQATPPEVTPRFPLAPRNSDRDREIGN